MGRPRTRLNILELKGADKKNPARLNVRKPEPEPPKGKAIAPRWLSARGKKAFKELAKLTDGMGVLTVADHLALVMICDAYADYMDADERVKADGMTYKIENREGVVVIKVNPAATLKADAWRRVMIGLGKFGMTPSERSNVSITKPKRKNKFDDD